MICIAVAAFVAFVVIQASESSLSSNTPGAPLDRSWRILIGLGCVPAVIALYFRLSIPETPRFTLDVRQNVLRARRDIQDISHASSDIWVAQGATIHLPDEVDPEGASIWEFIKHFSTWKTGKVLFGTAWSWLALDVRRVIH